MFCCKCGAEIHREATHCHKCGDVLPGMVATHSPAGSQSTAGRQEAKCHKCGGTAGLTAWDFGLGKVLSTNRAWSETAISAALSAVAVPLIGFGMLRLPGKRTSFSVLRLRLVLCDACLRNRVGYSAHPLWEEANRQGYTEFFGTTELGKLEHVP
jgi:hypothetical protein